MRRRNTREAGEGQGGCLVGIVLLLIVGFIAFKLVPVKAKASEVRAVVADECKSAGTHNDERIRKAILQEANTQGLPITDDSIQINRTPNLMRITVDYTVPVVFPGYTYQMHVHDYAENPIF
jgi:hypothetical protein